MRSFSALPDGFTLVELVTVIVLIGALAAVAGPRFFTPSTFEDRFFFDDAVHAARYARQFAVTKGCYTRFSLASTGFSLQRDSDCDSSTLNFSVAVNRPEDPGSAYSNSEAPSGTVPSTLVFDTEGRAGQLSGSTFAVFSATQSFTIGSRSFHADGETGFVR